MLTNEYRLLLLCARKVLTIQQLEDARSVIASGLDWDLLDRHVQDHGLSPLLYWHLQGNFPLAVPPVREQRLRVFENNVRNLIFSAALLNIVEAFRAAGIRALAYKGPALAMSLYGDMTLREMSDVDILIDRASFPAAREVLNGFGYQPVFTHTRKQQEARMRSDCECEFTSEGKVKVMVDLHWQISPPHLGQRFSFDDLWNRQCIVTLGGKPIPTFSAEDTVLVLAIHGGKHLWQRLSWLADFAESLRQNLDWQGLRLRARDARAERMLLLALALAEDIMQVPLPSELTAAIRDDDIVQAISANIAKSLFEVKNDTEENRNRWLTLLQLADSPWDAMRSAARFALASGPREWQAVRLPDSLFAFYPLLRIASLVRNGLSLFFTGRRASGDSR